MDEVSPKDGTLLSNDRLENIRKVRKSAKLKKPRGKPKGLPKSGGRVAQLKEDTSAWDEVLRQNVFNIPTEAIKLFFHKDTSNPLKFSILQFLAQYTTPSIKPIDKDSESSESSTTSDILKAVK